MEVDVAGERLFDCVQATWNLLEPSAGPALAEAHAAGMGVIVKEALANGRLTARNDDPAFAARRRVLEAEASRLGTTLDALALAAALARPWADVVLSGAATAEQLRSNLAASAVAWDDRAGERLGALAEDPEEYWATPVPAAVELSGGLGEGRSAPRRRTRNPAAARWPPPPSDRATAPTSKSPRDRSDQASSDSETREKTAANGASGCRRHSSAPTSEASSGELTTGTR